MNEVQLFFSELNILTQKEVESLNFSTEIKLLKKGDYFIREGQVANYVVFVRSGMLRSYFTKENGEEMTYCLTFPHRFMTAYTSFITGETSQENIQAISDTELIYIPKTDIEKNMEASANWIRVQKFFAEQMYVELEKRIFSYQRESAKERYEKLIATYPEYVQQVPLQYLASYLNITPRHLSRIRKK